jgi:hypothetical protein
MTGFPGHTQSLGASLGDGARMPFPLPLTGNGIVTKIASRPPARVPRRPRLTFCKSMKTYFRVPVGWNLLLGLIILLIAFGPSRAGADSAAPARSWQLVPSPSVPGVGQGLWAVTAISGTDAWAVGDVYNQAWETSRR